MSENDFEAIRFSLLTRLKELSPDLTYHCIAHTLDVLRQAEIIAREEGIKERDMLLLKIAALYHDSGFLESYRDHEVISCDIFMEDVNNTAFSNEEKGTICGLIMATRPFQLPGTLLEKIICDADLDYLGRDDFFIIADSLRNEFLNYDIVRNDDEWEEAQLKFLKSHKYYTVTAKSLREPVKQQNVSKLLASRSGNLSPANFRENKLRLSA